MSVAMVDPALQGQVDAQLLEQGAYSALELLFNAGRLSYSDYESWRRGELDSLDGVLMGDPAKICRQLDAAATHARSIGLVEQVQEFVVWKTAGARAERKLRISADATLERLIAARFVPAPEVPQMDLFFDNPIVALTNGIVRALASRNGDEAQRLLDRLYAQAPNHADLAGFDRLVTALGHLQSDMVAAHSELDFLLHVTPIAKRLLGAQARDLLVPLWRQLAVALGGMIFSGDQPQLHASFALSEAQDWAAVSECVLREPSWWRHEVLCLRLAHSCFHQQRRSDALKAWCHLCWQAPQRAAQLLEDRQPDRGLAALWQQFSDCDMDGAALCAADFPAWLLLHEPGLSQQLAEDLPSGDTPGEQHYRCVHRWLQARRAHRVQEELALRRELHAAQPMLFQKLKSTV
jgi:hypothetical protein